MATISAYSGFGIGLRRDHYRDFIAGDVDVDFVEVISENFMVDGGRPLRVLEQVRQKLPVILHGVSMSIGSAHGLDRGHMGKLKSLVDRIEPLWVSDHLCWTRTGAHNSHDLLPLPLTRASMEIVCENIDHAQHALGRAMLFENPSSYLTFPQDEMTEWEFLTEMSRRTGCYLLLDINNVYVSACNHGFDPADYLNGIPANRVRQVHLAGHTPGDIMIDTHDRPVCEEVWRLFETARRELGDVAVMVEWDDALPSLADLLAELGRARQIAGAARAELPA